MPNADSVTPLMVGPVSGPVSGQSVAFAEACKAIGDDAVVVDASFASIRAIPAFLWRLLVGFFRSSGPVYFTSSRSKVGFLARDLPIMLLSILSRRPMINHLHGNDFLSFRENAGRILGALIDFCYRRITISVAPTESLLLQYARYPQMRMRAIANFFDEDIARMTLRKALSGTLNVIFMSNLMHSKGFLVAAKAIDILVQEGADVKLFLCGTPIGDHEMSKAEVVKCTDDLRNHPHIEVIGNVSGGKKLDLLAEAHVFVLPTTYPTEAAPLSILEAFGAGCCVVTTDQGAITELVQDFHARTVEAQPHAVAVAIRELDAVSREPQCWEHNRTLAIARFSAEGYRNSVSATLSEAQRTMDKGKS